MDGACCGVVLIPCALAFQIFMISMYPIFVVLDIVLLFLTCGYCNQLKSDEVFLITAFWNKYNKKILKSYMSYF